MATSSNSSSQVVVGQVFKYDSEKPAFARKASASMNQHEYPEMVQYLAQLETNERIKFHPKLVERAPNVEIDDIEHHQMAAGDVVAANSTINNKSDENENDITTSNGNGKASCVASLRHEGLQNNNFSLHLLSSASTSINNNIQPPLASSSYIHITTLDVSHNELTELPGLAALCNLEVLCIKRNWFNVLPVDIGKLSHLKEINASRNFLKPNIDSLRLNDLKQLSKLQLLDISLNQKCRTAQHRSYIQQYLQQPTLTPTAVDVTVLVTVWQEASPKNGGEHNHNTIGSSAAQRNANLLRSQLEPWGTVNLRRRLVRDFGLEQPTDPKVIDRGEVMAMLLNCYKNEGLLQSSCSNNNNNNMEEEDLNKGIGNRRIIRVNGTPVRQELIDEILTELHDWRGNGKRGGSSTNRERPSIKATCYMILRAPPSSVDAGAVEQQDDVKGVNNNNTTTTTTISRREKRRHKKMEGNKRLWQLALQAMTEVDSDFAKRCSEVAVTYDFTGSPHIDRQNASPFYGLSLGNFTEGTGCVAVESSPRIVAYVNTKNKLGRVDGRYPHWVTSYDDVNEERFSLIYYDTMSAYQTPGPAIFTIPQEDGNKTSHT